MLTPDSKPAATAPCGADLRAETLEVAHAMVEQATHQEWQTVNALHVRLGRLLYKMLARPDPSELEATRSTLETVMQIAQTVSKLASAEREDTLEQLRRHRSHRSAAQLYRGTAS